MSPTTVAIMCFVILIVLMFAKVPILLSLLVSGVIGYALIDGFSVMTKTLGFVVFQSVYEHGMAVAPLFILMGNLLLHTGVAEDAYFALQSWLGKLPGGLIHATIFSNVVFAAMCGSTMAAQAIFAKVAVPQMKKAGYDLRLSAGTAAGAGPLAAMIPPSILMVIWSLLTDASLRRLFIGGVIPGLLIAVIFVVEIVLIAWRKPNLAPRGPSTSWKERFRSLKVVWPIMLIIMACLGTIYLGIATPTESAAFGAMGALLVGVALRRLTWRALGDSLLDAALLTGAVLGIMVAVKLFSQMVEISGLPMMVFNILTALNISGVVLIIGLMVMYLILGCIMDAPSMIFVTIATVVPLLTAYNIDLTWAGILVVCVAEIGYLTPPYGMGLFVVAKVLPEDCKVSVGGIVMGTLPYLIGYLVALALLIAFPILTLWLPGMMS